MSAHSFNRRIAVAVCLLPIVLLLLSGLSATRVVAAPSTIKYVTNTNDSGSGSLRQAVISALPGDTIYFSVTGSITLTTGAIYVGVDVFINGPGASLLTIDGNDTDRIFNAVGNLSISSLRLTNGHPSSGSGGAISSINALTITHCIFEFNQTSIYGGAIYASGPTELYDTIISHNTADRGGGIYYDGGSNRLELFTSVINENYAYSGAGGFYNNSGTAYILGGSYLLNNQSNIGGGGIVNETGAEILIADSTLFGNTAGEGAVGGGMINKGNAGLIHSSVISNSVGTSSGDGGGIANGLGGTLFLGDSTVMSNTAAGDAGGIENITDSTTDIYYSTIARNLANGNGAGILNQSGALTITDSTISDNATFGLFADGGGIQNVGTGSTLLIYDTIAGNYGTNSGGISSSSGATVTLVGTIIAGNTGVSANDCSATLTSLGYNLIQDPTGCTIGGTTTGNILYANPQLSPLQNNGGDTWTQALQSNSIAIDHGEAVKCPGIDQRDIHRPIDGDHDGVATCDIGAYERQIYVYLPLVKKSS